MDGKTALGSWQVRLPGLRLSLGVEAGRPLRRACLCLAQMVTAQRLLERPLETSSRPVALRQVCLDPARKVTVKRPLVIRPKASVLLPVACERACPLDRVKLAVLRLRREPSGQRQLLPVDCLLHAGQHELAEECSSGSQS